MARTRPVPDVLLVVAAFSRHPEALHQAQTRLQERFGPIALASEAYLFDQTDYYAASMGRDLRKQLWAFARLVRPDLLPDIKLFTNDLEQQFSDTAGFTEQRPINLDPGYLVLGKFLLATTKDQAHRVYLRDGIFAEVTLHFQAGSYRPWPWTYADYRLEEVIDFLGRAREYYRLALARPQE